MNKVKKEKDNIARIKVVGVGGGGGNAISRMSQFGTIRHVEFIAINTDAQDLDVCSARKKIYIGKSLTKGLGTGMNPEVGRQAAEENRSEIVEALREADLVFITAGLGGGTGTGASPIVAEAAREIGALTVAVVTKPFSFEGAQRAKIAQDGLNRLKDKVDTLIVVPNDRIFNVIDKNTSLMKAFAAIDDVLRNSVQTITDLVTIPGMINVDFADIKTIMKDAGTALVGIGVAGGADRPVKAVSAAVNSPLLEISMEGAKGVLFCVSGRDLKMTEVNEIAKAITETIDPGAKVIFGAYPDRNLKPGYIKVTVIATGFNGFLGIRSASSLFSSAGFGVGTEAVLKENLKESKLPEKPAAKTQKKETEKSESWDVPAFLRRRRR